MATVLVVEDDKLSQRLLAQILASGGHTALTAESVDAAWDLLQRSTLVDLAILDSQLSKGWGWELLQRIRGDIVFQHLPIVVYTAYTERSSILKYVEHRVQTMLVKPYRAEVVLNEVRKAVASDWTGRLIEPAESAARRLALSLPDYYSLLSASTARVAKSLAELGENMTTRPLDTAASEKLKRIADEATALGMPPLRGAVEALERSLNHRNLTDARAHLAQLQSLCRVMVHQEQRYLRLDGLAAPLRKLEPVRPPPPRFDAAALPANTLTAVYCRRTAAAPLWAFGKHLSGPLPSGQAAESRLKLRFVNEARPAVLSEIIQGFEFLRTLPYLGLDDLRWAVAALPGYEAVYLHITRRLGSLEDEHTVIDTPLAIHRLGVYRTGVLLTCARVAKAVPEDWPLDLSLLLQHTLTTTLLAYELGHSLKVAEENICASAGLAHDLGKWIFALGEPILYGLTLSLVLGRGLTMSSAERELGAVTHEELGATFIAATVKNALLEAAALHHPRPDLAEPAHRATVGVVALANQLAWAAAAVTNEQKAETESVLTRPDNPAWIALRQVGIELPMELPRLVASFSGLAQSSHWIGSVIAEWSRAKA